MASVLPPPMGCSKHCHTLCLCLSHFFHPVPAWSIPRAGTVSPGDTPVPTLLGASRDQRGGCSSGFLEMIFSVISTWCSGEVGKVTEGTGSGQSPPAGVWDGWGWLQVGCAVTVHKGDQRGANPAISHTMAPTVTPAMCRRNPGVWGLILHPQPHLGHPISHSQLERGRNPPSFPY